MRTLIVMLLALCSTASSAQMLWRGGVEQTEGKQAPGFVLSVPGVSVESGTARSGRCSVRVSNDGTRNTTFASEPIPLPGSTDRPRRLLVRAWVRAKDLLPGNQGWKAGRLLVWARDSEGNAVKTPESSNQGLIGDYGAGFSGTFGWREFSGNFVVPAGTASIVLDSGMSFASGTAWFDDFSVTEVPLQWKPREPRTASVEIDLTKLRTNPVEGIGWNWEFVWGPPYEMDAPNWFMDQLLHYAEWDQQSFVRFGYLAQHCFKDDMGVSAPAYDPTLPSSALYSRVLAGLKRLNITLLACNWSTGTTKGIYEKPPYPAGRFADAVAQVIHRWVADEGFTNIRYVSLWNEPCWSYPGKYPDDFMDYTKAFDARLRELGVRDKVRVLGSDSTESGPAAEHNLPKYNKILGSSVEAFAIHDYGAEVEAPGVEMSAGTLQPYLRNYVAAVRALREKPLLMSEFGTGAKNEASIYRGTLSNAELVIGGLNSGITAFSRWAYNCIWDPTIGYSPFIPKDQRLEPHRSVYYGYSILTKAVRPGMRAASCTVRGGRDSEGAQRVHAAAMRADDGSLAILLVNDGAESKTITLTGLPDTTLHHYWYDAGLPDGLQSGGAVHPRSQEITLRPQSINALTTRQWGRLKP